jgi:hypothetical protein
MTKARTLADNFAADINGITAGTGITGGGTSGTVTITNDMATTIAAKGDLIIGTGNDTYNRLAVASTAGWLLSVDSAETTGLKWAAPSGGDFVKISSVTWSSASSQALTSVFSSSYDDYCIVFDNMQGSTVNDLSFRMRSGSSNDTNSTYYYANIGRGTNGTTSNAWSNGTDTFRIQGLVTSPHVSGLTLWVFNPYESVRTSALWTMMGSTSLEFTYVTGGGVFAANTSFDGLGFFCFAGGNLSGDVTVYGLKK